MDARKATFKSTNGRDSVVYNVWTPEGEPEGVVHLLHGMCEHIDRYDRFACFLRDKGFVVCGQNHVGHGPTAPDESGLGWFGLRDGYKALYEDTHALVSLMKAEYPGKKYVILGHSMGSFVARLYYEKYGDEVDCALFEGTSGGNSLSWLIKLIARVQRGILGDRKEARFIDKLTHAVYLQRIKGYESPHDWISTDREFVADFGADPFCTFSFKHSGYIDLMTMLEECNREEWFKSVPRDKPVLLFSGEEDPIGDYGKGVMKVYDRLKGAGVNVTLKLYPGLRHDLLNEVGYEEVFGFVHGFIAQNVT